MTIEYFSEQVRLVREDDAQRVEEARESGWTTVELFDDLSAAQRFAKHLAASWTVMTTQQKEPSHA